MLRRFFVLPALLCLLTITAFTLAQDQPAGGGATPGGAAAGGGGGGGNRPGGGNFDPAAFRQRMMNNIKDQLGASDDEWQVLQPKIEKVMTSQRELRVRMNFFRPNGGGGGGGGGGGFGANDDSPVAKATQDLRDTLDNKDASADVVTQKLTALRDARTKAQADLTAAQKDLKDVLTQRQEASLVMMGMLE
jgi:hypothetical protein